MALCFKLPLVSPLLALLQVQKTSPDCPETALQTTLQIQISETEGAGIREQ